MMSRVERKTAAKARKYVSLVLRDVCLTITLQRGACQATRLSVKLLWQQIPLTNRYLRDAWVRPDQCAFMQS